jgi:hypothetical protein
MPRLPARPERSRRLPLGFLFAAAFASVLAACASGGGPQGSPPLEWRLVPSTTVLGDRRQFFIHGKGLQGAEAVSDPSVTVEPGVAKGNGETYSLYLTVAPLGERAADSTVLGEKPGLRKVRVKTPDTTVVFSLKVLDER